MNTKKAKRKKKPWPTKDAMEQIYALNLWGRGDADFYSGTGSHHPELVDPYVEVVSSFLQSFDHPLVVCDIGCGDFNVGRQLVRHAKTYKAVDIVTDLIERNKKKFTNHNLSFHCLDMAADAWPSGDCVILRNVLQHLSNAEIEQIVLKLPDFSYAIVTEHVPKGDFVPNKDIISGQGIRLKKGSGVNLLAPPFNLEILAEEQWLRMPSKDAEGLEVTTLYRLK